MSAPNSKVSEMIDNLELNIVLSGTEDSVFVAEGFIEIIKYVEVGIGSRCGCLLNCSCFTAC